MGGNMKDSSKNSFSIKSAMKQLRIINYELRNGSVSAIRTFSPLRSPKCSYKSHLVAIDLQFRSLVRACMKDRDKGHEQLRITNDKLRNSSLTCNSGGYLVIRNSVIGCITNIPRFSLLFMLCLYSFAFSAEDIYPRCGEKHFFWKVSGKESSVWVLGSIHMADSGFYPLPAVIEDAFQKSDALVLEMDMSDNEVVVELAAYTLQEAVTPGGVELEKMVPPETWNALKMLLEGWGMPLDIVRFSRPWAAAMAISTIAIQKSGISSEYGIDFVLLDKAAAAGKAILGLETPKQQIGALSGVSDSIGAVYLQNTLNEMAQLDFMITELTEAWKCGQVKRMQVILKADESLPGEMENRIYHERNITMAKGIDKLLREKTNAFVVVGTAHLIGKPKTVLDLLREKGYHIERF